MTVQRLCLRLMMSVYGLLTQHNVVLCLLGTSVLHRPAVLQLSGEADFVFADGALVFPDGQRKPFAQDANETSLQRDNTILISAVCYRAALHTQLGRFDETLPYYWDWDWYLRVARTGKILTRLKTPSVDIRIHAQNMSGHSNTEARATNLKRLCDKHGLPEIPLKSHVDFV
jgi:hypothetical protein